MRACKLLLEYNFTLHCHSLGLSLVYFILPMISLNKARKTLYPKPNSPLKAADQCPQPKAFDSYSTYPNPLAINRCRFGGELLDNPIGQMRKAQRNLRTSALRRGLGNLPASICHQSMALLGRANFAASRSNQNALVIAPSSMISEERSAHSLVPINSVLVIALWRVLTFNHPPLNRTGMSLIPCKVACEFSDRRDD